jgi:hypothetical protein
MKKRGCLHEVAALKDAYSLLSSLYYHVQSKETYTYSSFRAVLSYL